MMIKVMPQAAGGEPEVWREYDPAENHKMLKCRITESAIPDSFDDEWGFSHPPVIPACGDWARGALGAAAQDTCRSVSVRGR